MNWTTQKPTKPGLYHWRKNAQWEPVTREVRRSRLCSNPQQGVLVTYSHRFEQWVPLEHLDASGSEWGGEVADRNEVTPRAVLAN